jgi:4-amino-4-deoxychorismate lyase
MKQDKVIADDGFFFSLGVFETIAVAQGRPVLIEKHLQRMKEAMELLQIHNQSAYELTKEDVCAYLEQCDQQHDVLKLTVTDENLLWNTRKNHYSTEDYERGFSVGISSVRRNETSLFSYVKSLNYGDNILEKRKAKVRGIDEPLFLNNNGCLTEGATTNIFFVKEGCLYTPARKCGLLNGTVREWVMERYPVKEICVTPDDLQTFDEIFLTNALMGVMPVRSFEGTPLYVHTVAEQIFKDYKEEAIRA